MNSKIFMLCEGIKEKEVCSLDKSRYLANEKYDGERCLAIVDNGEVIMMNRRGRIINENFKDIERELIKLPNCFLDGEIIVNDEKGCSKFEFLQSRALTKSNTKIAGLEKTKPAIFMIFDILSLERDNFKDKPLIERIKSLYFLIGEKFNNLKFVEYEEIDESLRKAKEKGSEGIIIKDMKSRYENRRSKSWLKCKFFNETTLILTSFKPNNAGYRCEDNLGNAVQVQFKQGKEVAERIGIMGKCEVYIQYLSKTKNERYRFISFRGIK